MTFFSCFGLDSSNRKTSCCYLLSYGEGSSTTIEVNSQQISYQTNLVLKYSIQINLQMPKPQTLNHANYRSCKSHFQYQRISKMTKLHIYIIKLMQPAQRLSALRKQIRKEHLDSIFTAKRIKLLQQNSPHIQQSHLMELEKDIQEPMITALPNQPLGLDELRRIASLSQSQPGIEIIHVSLSEPRLIQYLKENYVDSDEQYYASYIICNLYYLALTAPSEQLTQDMCYLLQVGDMRTLQNIFFFLNNVISNYPSCLNILITNHHLIDRLASLFKRFEKPTLSYLGYLLQIIFKCLQRAGKEQGFLKLKVPIRKLVMLKESQEMKELIKRAAFCYYILIKCFPNELTSNIVKFGILNKFIELTWFFAEKKYTFLVLEIIELSLPELTEEYVHTMVIPYLIKLASLGFELGDQSAIFQAKQLKVQTYRLIKLLLQSYKMTVQYFGSLKLGEMLLQQFESSEDKQLLVELSYIFVQVWLNSDNEQLRTAILKLINRAQMYNKEDFQFNAYLHQFASPI